MRLIKLSLTVALILSASPWRLAFAGELYFNDAATNNLLKVNVDGSNLQYLATVGSAAGAGTIQSLALDLPNRTILFSQDARPFVTSDQGMFRVSLSNGEVTQLFSTPREDDEYVLEEITSIAINPNRTKIYYGSSESFDIYRSNMDGSGLELAVADIGNDQYVLSIDFDSQTGDILWTQAYPDDGETGIMMGREGESSWSPLAHVFADSMDINQTNRDIYFTAFDSIKRLSGNEVQDVVTGLNRPIKVQVDPLLGKLFWIESYGKETNTIRAANLDGTNVVDLVTGIRATDLVLLPEIVGDFDNDSLVTNSDFGVWQSQFGTSVTPFTGGDANGDGLVDGHDFNLWNANRRIEPAEGTFANPVPEPGALGIALVAGLLASLCRKVVAYS